MPSGSSLSSQEDGALSLASNGNGNGRRCVTNGATTSSVLVSSDNLEQWKQEIMNEVRRELTKAKSDIIDGKSMFLLTRTFAIFFLRFSATDGTESTIESTWNTVDTV